MCNLFILLLLSSCTPDRGKESASPTDTADTSDMDTSDSSSLDPYWDPGDEIPGWEDFECPENVGGNVITIDMPSYSSPDSYRPSYGIDAVPEGLGKPGLVSFEIGDCVNLECKGDPYSIPFLFLLAATNTAEAATERGLGEYGPGDTSSFPRSAQATAAISLGWFESSKGDYFVIPSAVTACLSRVRPDMITGFVRFEVASEDLPFDLEYYDELFLVFPFSYIFQDHAGIDESVKYDPKGIPEEVDTSHITYSCDSDRFSCPSYDEAWPWDEITDPAIREAVYERYTPYNTL